MALLPKVVNAYDVQIDGIFYDIDKETRTATVTYSEKRDGCFYSYYSGAIVIPSEIIHDDIKYSVTCIGRYAFVGCSDLTSVEIPQSVTKIGDYAFPNCSGLTSITIPKDVSTLGENAFYNCNNLIAVHISDLSSWCKISFSNIDSNPLFYAHHLFLNGEEIKELVIPNSIANIGNCSFVGCSGLTSIEIPNGVSRIGHSGFYGCSNITSIKIPNSVTSIGEWAFRNCEKLATISMGENIKKMGAYVFENTAWFDNHADGIVYLGHVLYKYKGTMPQDSRIEIEDGTKCIAEFAFDNCTGLKSLVIPSSVSHIGFNAFLLCKNLMSIYISDLNAWNNITFEKAVEENYYSPSGFNYAYHLYIGDKEITEIKITEGKTEIEDYRYAGWAGLKTISIPNSIVSIGYGSFANCINLTAIEIPNSVTIIKDYTFSGCGSLSSLVFPEGITVIGGGALAGCNGLKSIELPNSLTSMPSAFVQIYGNDYSSLTTVSSHMVSPFLIDSKTFPSHLKDSGTLYIPSGTRNKYIEKGWTLYFANVIEMEDGEPIWLSIVDAAQGKTMLKCKRGEAYTLRFEAVDGWKVHSVTYRGADVTSWLTADNEFTTPAMAESAELYVAYEQEGSDVKSTRMAAVRVFASGGDIVVSGAPAGTPISVFDLSGRLITSETANEGETRISVNAGGEAVIVKVGERSVKVMVK